MFDRLYKRPRVVARHRKRPAGRGTLPLSLFTVPKQEMSPLTLQNVARYTLVVAEVVAPG